MNTSKMNCAELRIEINQQRGERGLPPRKDLYGTSRQALVLILDQELRAVLNSYAELKKATL